MDTFSLRYSDNIKRTHLIIYTGQNTLCVNRPLHEIGGNMQSATTSTFNDVYACNSSQVGQRVTSNTLMNMYIQICMHQ